MPERFGIDTSILVRLMTGDPEAEFGRCVRALQGMIEREDAEIFASCQVIGESYIAVQHHYGIHKEDARSALVSVLESGLVAPVNGPPVLEALAQRSGAGLLDRLIAIDYAGANLETLTLDRKMATRYPGHGC